MSDRLRQSGAFLESCGWQDATRQPLADDASFRRYERLIRGTGAARQQAVLMDAPPAFENVRPFVAVARYLQSLNLAAPVILAQDLERGFLLLEDLGDALFVRLIRDNPAQEVPLYRLAIEGLLELQQATPAARLEVAGGEYHRLPRYDMDLMLREVGLFCDWYLPAVTGKSLDDAARRAFMEIWRQVLAPVTEKLDHMVLRDYHTENLMLREKARDMARLGLLDFQDAVIGHRAYDMVSLLQDARREVPPALEADMIGFYIDRTGIDAASFRRDYALLGAQRNAKIIGIFARLFLRDGKATYLRLVPRVWGLLDRCLDHPALAPVRAWMADHVPAPTRRAPFTPQNIMPQKAMILAAGLGRRMRPLTDHCPKPLVPVAGKPILSHTLEKLSAAGVRDVVVNMHYLADQVADFCGRYYDHRLTFTLSDERERLLDSGGGVKRALPHLVEPETPDAPFFVLNSDMMWRDGDRQQLLQRMQAFWRDEDMDILMMLVPRENALGYDGPGDFDRDAAGRLRPRGDAARADHVYGGLLMMKPACVRDLPGDVFSLREPFRQAAARGRLFGVLHSGEWYHVGTAAVRDRVEAIIAKGG